MTNPEDFEVKLIDFKTHKNELMQLRKLCWEVTKSIIKYEEFFTEKDLLVDYSSIHCGLFKNEKLIASHRLQTLNSLSDLPFAQHFNPSKIIGSNWYTYSKNENDYVVMTAPIVTTGRLVIHPAYRKVKISEKILTFWIKYSKQNNFKTLISFPSPWMINKLIDVGFKAEKGLGFVFAPLPSINITLMIKKF
jgi:predicted GNAT family N-acyltransferase